MLLVSVVFLQFLQLARIDDLLRQITEFVEK